MNIHAFFDYNKSIIRSTEYVQQPQDTLLRPTRQDSVEASAYGVDPLFIMNERRAKEIEEYRLQQIRIARWRAKQAEATKVDTTCQICPQEPVQGVYQILDEVNNSNNTLIQLSDFLYDKDFSVNEKITQGQVFIETNPRKTFVSKRLVKEYRTDSYGLSYDWVFYPLLGLFIMIAILKVFYSRFVNYFFQSSFYVFVASKIHRENSLLGRRIIFMLDFIFFTSISIFIVLALNFFNIDNPINSHPISLFLAAFSILLGYRILRYALVFFTGYISKTEREMRELFFNQLIYPRILGLILVPLILIITFSRGYVSDITFYLTLSIIAIALIIRTIRSVQVFISKGFSIFYFLLYLCALEITPIIIFLKEASRG